MLPDCVWWDEIYASGSDSVLETDSEEAALRKQAILHRAEQSQLLSHAFPGTTFDALYSSLKLQRLGNLQSHVLGL